MKGKKVIVAMSGGVDSSVAAAILKKNGYDVVGVFMRMHEKSNPKDARVVAQKLKIPFKVLDVRKEFKKKVINYFIKEYKRGNTPNPCVECNPQIKFKFLVDLAIKMKADYVATGHYARIKSKAQNPNYSKSNPKSKFQIYKLLIAKDEKKDQSYFLWQLNKKQLSKVIFPLGDYAKEQVRGLAKKFEIPVAEKKDSQEVCFVNTNMNEFLGKRIKTNKGPIIMVGGDKVGEHKGLIFYTIGQRKGIEIGGTGPYYVIKKDFNKNTLIVSNSQKDLLQKEMMVKNINWLSGKPYFGKCKVKIRSMAPMVPVKIIEHVTHSMKQKKYKVIFDKEQRAVTPGQSAVFYKGNELLGGGIIT
jgi:tRNA-specific 2-thiouridylase